MERVSSLRILEGEPSKVSNDEVDALILPNICDALLALVLWGTGNPQRKDERKV